MIKAKVVKLCLLNTFQSVHKDGTETEGEILLSYADITRSKQILHFIAKKGIDKGLRELIEPMILGK